jgi:hypothetical protein
MHTLATGHLQPDLPMKAAGYRHGAVWPDGMDFPMVPQALRMRRTNSELDCTPLTGTGRMPTVSAEGAFGMSAT